MAKMKSLFSFEGTFGGVTPVRSIAYGDHVRAPRGSKKKAEVNDSFKRSSAALVAANRPAQLIYRALTPYCKDLREGKMWPRLLSVFRNYQKTQGSFHFKSLEHFEIHSRYPLSRFAQPRCETVYDPLAQSLHVRMLFDAHPDFHKFADVDSYRLDVLVIYPSLATLTAPVTVVNLPLIRLVEALTPLESTLQVPKEAEAVAVGLRLTGCKAGEPLPNRKVMGMQLVHVLELL